MSFSRVQGGGRSVEGGERPCVRWNPAADGIPRNAEFRGTKITFCGGGFWRGADSRCGWIAPQEIERGIGISVGSAIECDRGNEEGYGGDNGSVEWRGQWQMIERMKRIISVGW